MNAKLGRISSLITLAAVAAFAFSMLAGSDFAAYLSSMFIAWGFVPMICALASRCEKDKAAFGFAAIAFAAVYALLIMLVYFAQLTSVRLDGLSGEALRILDYKNFGLFFSYDLLGYAFMALATFFIAFAIAPRGGADKALRALLMIHGLFAVSCVLLPMLGLFSPDMAGGDLIGILVLEFWCVYFIPVCVLSYLHFRRAD
jgi:hypothetical protein